MAGTSRHLTVAVRRLRHTPLFTLATVATLALALACVTAGFNVADTLLLRPLPYPQSQDLVDVTYAVPGYGYDRLPFSVGTFVHTRREQRSLDAFAIYYDSDRHNVGRIDPERVPVARVTPGFFEVFQVPLHLGRGFTEEDGRPGAEPTVIVSYDLWQRRWGGDPGLMGRTEYVEGVERRVVGVAPERFDFPNRRTGLWIPFTIDPANLQPMSFGYPGVARLAPGVSLEAADTDVRRITLQLPEVYPDRLTPTWVENGQFDSHVAPLASVVVGDVGTEIWLVFATAVLLLLLAAATIANLFMVRAQERSRELAIREALGSGRRGLVAPILSESMVVGALSGLAGLGLTALILRLTVRYAPPDLPRVAEIGLTPSAAVLALGAALLASVAFGGLSTMAVRTGSPHETLRSSGAGSSGGTRGAAILRQLLVGNQAALAVALLVGAGLLLSSARDLGRVDPGFDTQGVLTFEVGLPAEEYDAGDRPRVWQQLVERIAMIDGVEAVGAGEFLPLSTDFRRGPLHQEGEDLAEGVSGPVVDLKRITPGYFGALGIPVLEGRDLEWSDGVGGFPAVVVNQTLVQRFMGGGPALGKRVRVTTRGEYSEIVGVVGNVRTESFREEAPPFLYFPSGTPNPAAPGVPAAMSFALSTSQPWERVLPAAREAVAEVDAKLPLGSLRGMDDIVAEHLARQRLIAGVLLVMALLGLTLAAVGVYGVVGSVVARKRKEVSVRLALGASPGRVTARVAGGTVGAVVAGAAAGLAVALLAGGLLEQLLFGVSADDARTHGWALSLVVGSGFLASFVPAWRATRTDPQEVLREE